MLCSVPFHFNSNIQIALSVTIWLRYAHCTTHKDTCLAPSVFGSRHWCKVYPFIVLNAYLPEVHNNFIFYAQLTIILISPNRLNVTQAAGGIKQDPGLYSMYSLTSTSGTCASAKMTHVPPSFSTGFTTSCGSLIRSVSLTLLMSPNVPTLLQQCLGRKTICVLRWRSNAYCTEHVGWIGTSMFQLGIEAPMASLGTLVCIFEQ